MASACGRAGAGCGHQHLDPGPRFDAMARLHYGRPVHTHATIGNEPLKAGAAHVSETAGEQAIEALAGIGRAGGQREFP